MKKSFYHLITHLSIPLFHRRSSILIFLYAMVLLLGTNLTHAQEVTFAVDMTSEFNTSIDKVTIKLKNVHSSKMIGSSSNIVNQFGLSDSPLTDDIISQRNNVLFDSEKTVEYEITISKKNIVIAGSCIGVHTNDNFSITYGSKIYALTSSDYSVTSSGDFTFKGTIQPEFNRKNSNVLTGANGSSVNPIISNPFIFNFRPEVVNDSNGNNTCKKAFAVSIYTATIGSKPIDVLGTAVSPQIPWIVLHDPPGDGSYSYFEENKKVCRQTTLQYDKGAEAGGYASAKLGAKGSVGGGFIVEASTDFEAYVETTASFNAGARKTGTKTYETCLDFSSRFQTSGFAPNSQAAITGNDQDQDIFIGMGTVYKFGEFDDFIIDNSLNQVVADNGLMFTPTSFTQFIRTEESIREDIVAQRAAFNNASLDGHDRAKAGAQANAWEKILEQNRINKLQAEVVPEFQNQTYDAGPTIEQKWTTTITETDALEVEIYFESKASIDGKAEVAGSGVSGGAYVMGRTSRTQSSTGTSEDTEAIGYHLEDDDVGTDKFIIDVKKDKKYGTPVFELDPQSITSCPYEGGIKANQPDLTAEDENGDPQEKVEYHTWPGNTISIPLNVCNLSTLERKYEIKLNSGTNVNNAEIKLGGAILDSSNPASFTVAAKNGDTKSCFSNNGVKPKLLISQPANVSNPEIEYKNITLSLYNCEKEFSDEITIDVIFDLLDPEKDEDGDGVLNKNDNCPELAGRGFAFDGRNDQIIIPTGVGNFGVNDFSMEFWVKTDKLPEANDPSTVILAKQERCSADNYWRFSYDHNGELTFAMKNFSANEENSITSVTNIADGKWHYIAVTRDANDLTLYIDGQLDDQVNAKQVRVGTVGPLRLAANICSDRSDQANEDRKNFFQGVIDELRIHDRALSTAQVGTNSKIEIAANGPGLVAYYNFEQGLVNQINTLEKTLIDRSGNGHNGQLDKTNLTANNGNWTFGAPLKSYDSDGNGIGDACELPASGSLAVEWLAVEVYLHKQNAATTQWSVRSTENVAYFIVEHSTNAHQWQAIGEVMVDVPSAEEQTYRFIDKQPAKGINYYRIKEIAVDGKTSYSAIKKLWLENAVAALRVFPNPTNGELTITASDVMESQTTLTLFDLVGKVVYQQPVTATSTNYQATINLDHLPSGIYTLQLENNGQSRVERIVKR